MNRGTHMNWPTCMNEMSSSAWLDRTTVWSVEASSCPANVNVRTPDGPVESGLELPPGRAVELSSNEMCCCGLLSTETPMLVLNGKIGER